MEFEFDPAKDEANRFKHGLRLQFGLEVFADREHVFAESFRAVDGEDRYKAIGLIEGKLYTVIHVWRDDSVRLISVRRSNSGEQAYYNRHSG